MLSFRKSCLLTLILTSASAYSIAGQNTINSGDTAWMLTSTALVLFMAIPGVALFYGGMVRSKNVLSIMMQCFAITGLITVLWILYGYSLAFSATGMMDKVTNFHSFIGSLDNIFLKKLSIDSLTGTFPETVWITFQLTFAIITPILIIGAFAERIRFSAMMLYMALWFTLCYLPIAHMVWGGPGALLEQWSVIDFAGGTVVHVNSGIAGLVTCIMLGKRKGYPSAVMAPHNLPFTLIGTAMLWFGWFGFNAGSAGAANAQAGMAMLVTQIAAATAGLTWMICEWIIHKKPSALGIASGVIAGLVVITPAAGTVGPGGAIIMAILSGVACFFSVTVMKRKIGYDDSLDAFGIHGLGGIIGAILTGVFAAPVLGGFGEVSNIIDQVIAQTFSVIITLVYTGIMTTIIFVIVDKVIGMRVTDDDEMLGLDLASHNERAYNN